MIPYLRPACPASRLRRAQRAQRSESNARGAPQGAGYVPEAPLKAPDTSRPSACRAGLADLALQAVGETGLHGAGDVLHHATAVLGDGSRHVDVLADLDVGLAALVRDLGHDVGARLPLALLLAADGLHHDASGLVVELGDGDGAGEGEVH